jgi:hypothetical protein
MRIASILTAALLLTIAHQANAQYYTNQYLSLDGINDFLSTPNHDEINFDSAFTIECWVYAKDTTGSNKVICSKVNSANTTGCALLLMGSGSNPNIAGRLQLNINGTSNILQATGTRLSLNNWNHIAVTFKDGGGVNVSDTVRFFVNGVQSASFNRLIEPVVSNSDSLRIGNCYLPALYSNGFNGYIDDLRFYKTRRLPAFIAADRGIAIGLDGISNILSLNSTRYVSLTSSWRFDGNGSDMVGIQNTLYLRNGASFIPTRFNPVTYRNQSNYYMSLAGNSYLAAADTMNSLYDADTAITVEAWVYVDSLYESVRPIVHKGLSYTLGLTGVGNKPYAQINNGALLLIANSSIQPRRWTHIAFSYRGSSAWMALYINGKENIRQNFNPGAILVSNDSLQIGRSETNVTLNGKVDEVRICKFAKDEASIARYMHTSLDNLNTTQFSVPFASFGFEGNTKNSVNQSGKLFLRGDAYFEWVNAVNAAAGVSQPPMLRVRENDNGSPSAFKSTLPFSIRNNSTARDSVLVSNVTGSARLKVVVLLGHTYMDDVDLSLRSPSGTSYILSNDRGATGNDLLTMFYDLADSSGSDLNAPSSMMIKPQTGFGNAGSNNANGYWRLTATDDNAANLDSGIVYRWWLEFEQPASISYNSEADAFELFQNYPNPFNPETVISYKLQKTGYIELAIYDITGKAVRIAEKGIRRAGSHEVMLNSDRLAAGAYFYKLTSGNRSVVKKMIVLK